MTAAKSLHEYRSKRNFRNTTEPKGRRPSSHSRPIFVVQQHDATSLHYDFRLEMDGVLKSWAVPKGPSLNPRDKRLAMATEDHPLEYARFEGVIPEGEYGAGPVLVWDRGTYSSLHQEGGHLTFMLKGKKLKGAFSLTRIGKSKTRERWLLVKKKDEYADARRNPVNTWPESVLTGRTLKEIATA